MMALIQAIDDFAVNVYLNMPVKIKKDYVDICQKFSDIFDAYYTDQTEMQILKNEVLMKLFSLMEKGDFILMAEALLYELKPMLKEIVEMEEGTLKS